MLHVKIRFVKHFFLRMRLPLLNLVELAEKLASHQELRLTPTLKQQLEQVSVATVQRHLPQIPLAERRRQPRPALNQHQQNIPTRMIPRNTAQPGHFEVDLVYHCGGDLDGEFVFTLQLIDVATGWSARRAILGRSYLVMEDALISLMARIPFPIREFHPDNGGEFLNAHLLTFLKTRYPEITLSRSRPAHPNDNRLVEQKNHTLVRQYLGQRRFDTVTQTRFLNTTYDQLSDLYNYIQPVMRQIDKQWVPDSDSRSGYFKRIHDQARSPFRRLCETDCLSQDKLLPLAQHYADLNPVRLRRDIYKALDHLFAYPNALPNQVQNIFQTIDNVDLFPEVIAALNIPDPVLSPIPAKEVAVLTHRFIIPGLGQLVRRGITCSWRSAEAPAPLFSFKVLRLADQPQNLNNACRGAGSCFCPMGELKHRAETGNNSRKVLSFLE